MQQQEGLHTEILEVALTVRILDPEDTKLHSIKQSTKNVYLGSLGYSENHRKDTGHSVSTMYLIRKTVRVGLICAFSGSTFHSLQQLQNYIP